MKNKASTFLKQVFSAITAIVKAKSMAVKGKTSAIKARLLIFSFLRNKKVLMSAINHKIHALMGKEKVGEAGYNYPTEDYSKGIVAYKYNAVKNKCGKEEEDDYPDPQHSLFEFEDDGDDDELGDGTGLGIDLVKNSMEDGQELCLEDEIDNMADVFIRRFHNQLKMQKLQSLKQYKEMLERSV